MVTIVVLGLCHRNNDLFGKIKSTRNVLEPPVMPQPKDWLDKLFTRTTPNDKFASKVRFL